MYPTGRGRRRRQTAQFEWKQPSSVCVRLEDQGDTVILWERRNEPILHLLNAVFCERAEESRGFYDDRGASGRCDMPKQLEDSV